MSDKNKRTYNYIIEIYEKISKIKSKMKNIDFDQFLDNDDLQEIVEYNLLIIGEAISQIPIDILKKYRDEDFYWRQIKDMRNILIHHYWGVDLEMVYQVVQVDLIELEVLIKDMLINEKN